MISQLVRPIASLCVLLMIGSACTSSEKPGSTDKSPQADATIPVSKKPPNILIIQTDDQRATGTLVAMPATRRIFLDKGTRFTNAMATTPVCCPARTSVLTGQYAHNHGVTSNFDAGPLQARQGQTLQAALQRGGYQTAIAGKLLNTWRMGDNPKFFSQWAFTRGGYYGAVFNVNGTVAPVDGYSTDFIGEKTSEFLDDFEEQDSSPWFIHVNTYAPHLPYTAEPRYEDADVPPWNPSPAVLETDKSDKPSFVRESDATADDGEEFRAEQLRTLMSVDDLVSQVFSKMDDLDETRDTLAFYVSDHGYLWGDHGRLGKRSPYSPSTNIPMIVRWPGHFPIGSRDDLVANIDFAPTILEAAGIKPPKSWTIDGDSFLDGEGHSELILEYWEEPGHGFPSWAALRTEDWIYVEYLNKERDAVFAREYYDLQSDPFQLTNLLQDGKDDNDPDVDQLHQRLVEEMTCKGSSCP